MSKEPDMIDKMFGKEGSQMGEIGKEVMNTVLGTGLLKKADVFIAPLLKGLSKFLGDERILIANSENGETNLTIVEKELKEKILSLIVEEVTKNPKLIKVHSVDNFANMIKDLNLGDAENIDDIEDKVKQITSGAEDAEVINETK